MRITVFFLLAFLLCGALNAQTELSLSEAVKIGLKNNYQVSIIERNTKIAENNDSWGAAGRFPVINIGAQNINRYDNRPSVIGEGRDKYTNNQISPYLQLNWTIFEGFSIGLTKDNLERLRELAKGDETDLIETTVQDIILAYYKVLLEKEKIGVFREVTELSRDRYNSVLLKQEIGNAVTFEVLQEKNSYLRDSANFISQIVFHKNALRDLLYLLNIDTTIDYQLTEAFETDLKDYSLKKLAGIMIKNNRVLKNLRINQEMLENNVELAETAWYPSLSLSSGFDYSKGISKYEGADPADFYSYDAYANLSLNYLIFNGGNRSRAAENAKVEEEIGRLRISDTELFLKNSLKNLYELYELRKQLYEVAMENKKSARLNLDIAEEKFRTGAINSFNYRDIQLVYLNAAIDELQSVYDLIDAEVKILKLTGSIIGNY